MGEEKITDELKVGSEPPLLFAYSSTSPADQRILRGDGDEVTHASPHVDIGLLI